MPKKKKEDFVHVIHVEADEEGVTIFVPTSHPEMKNLIGRLGEAARQSGLSSEEVESIAGALRGTSERRER